MSILSPEFRFITSSILGSLLALSLSSPSPGAESIETELLRLTIDVESQRFAINDKSLDRDFIKRGTFTHPVESVHGDPVADSIWGRGQELTIIHSNGWKTLMRLHQKHPFVHIQTVAANRSEEPITVSALRLFELDYDLGIPPENVRSLGTGGLGPADAAGSYSFVAIADPKTRHGIVCGWLTHERGIGVFFPRVADGRTAVAAQVDFGQFRIEPGGTRPVETAVIGYFDDARLGLEAYADAVAQKYGIKLAPQPSVYCTWYHGGASNQQRIADNTRFAAEHLQPFGLNVMQIDDKWQAILPKGFAHDGTIKRTGPIKVFVDSNENYPDGMAHTAETIASQGMVPGIWFMPFAGNFRNPYFDQDLFAKNPDGTPFHDARWSGTCLDLSQPKTQAFVAARVQRIHDWGYRYFKLDGMHTGAPSKNIYVHTEYRSDTFPDSRLQDPRVTHVEAYRKGLQTVRENAPDAFVLGCNVSQNMVSMGPAFGLIDAMRIGPDNGSAGRGNFRGVKVGAWHGSTLYFLNGRVWHNDPDPVYVRESIPLHMAQLMCSWVAVTGSMLTTSYQFSELPNERLELLKRTMPGHGLLGRPADLFETDQPQIWLLSDTRGDVRRDVIGLFNWSENEPAKIRYDLGPLGLDPKLTYCAFDFWKNSFLAPIRSTLEQTLPGGSCRVLAVRPVTDHPQLLSTSRHIAQCMVDVLQERWDSTTNTLSGRSKVVAGDPYEMRIALPEGGNWRVKNATAGDQPLTLMESTAAGLRLRCTPTASGTVAWRIDFQ
jgi:hypothetical protein